MQNKAFEPKLELKLLNASREVLFDVWQFSITSFIFDLYHLWKFVKHNQSESDHPQSAFDHV